MPLRFRMQAHLPLPTQLAWSFFDDTVGPRLTGIGSWGDRSHRSRISCHNSGRALDLMTRDPEVHRFIVAVALSHRRTLDIRRIISWDRQWSAASAWQPVPYRGTSRHRDHVHLSIGCDL